MRKTMVLMFAAASAACVAPAAGRVELTTPVRMSYTQFSHRLGQKNPFSGWHDANVVFVTGTELEELAKQDPSLAKLTKMVFTASRKYAIITQRGPDGTSATNIAEFQETPEPCGLTFDAHCLGNGIRQIRARDYYDRIFQICVNGSCPGG